jgi:hypothetical protein
MWWNFVDGGYADSSGATTALELYQAIQEFAKHGRLAIAIDLKLLILTEAGAGVAGKQPSGAGLVSAISPLTTVLAMREQTGKRAVARALKALDGLGPEESSRNVPANACAWEVAAISLDPRALELPLGWLISQHTVDVIDQYVSARNTQTIAAIKESIKQPCQRPYPRSPATPSVRQP